jgi:hypothetical protein
LEILDSTVNVTELSIPVRMDGAFLGLLISLKAIAQLRNAYEITSRFDCALGHATCLLGCSENSKGNAAWAITGKT